MPPSPSWKVVYAVVERPGKKHWLRIGMAFVNRDGSLNVRLDAVPLTGQLQIRDSPSQPESADPLPDASPTVPISRAPNKRSPRRQP